MEHPGLKNFNPTWETIKHVGGKALKWAAVTALVVGAAPIALGGLVGILPGLSVFQGAAWLGAGALQSGAMIGAALGAISGVGGLGDALENRKQDAIADYEQAQVSRERAQMMARSAGQSVPSGGVSPSAGYGRTSQQGVGI